MKLLKIIVIVLSLVCSCKNSPYQLQGFHVQAYHPQAYHQQLYQPQAYQPEAYQPPTYQPQAYKPQTYPQIYNPQFYQPQFYQQQQVERDQTLAVNSCQQFLPFGYPFSYNNPCPNFFNQPFPNQYPAWGQRTFPTPTTTEKSIYAEPSKSDKRISAQSKFCYLLSFIP